jgi:S-DNA-T family DNA segregation ATPase FtsK/SpoIIIE
MRSLAKYFYEIIKNEYRDWKSKNNDDGLPGRLILKEFDTNLVREILLSINSSDDLPTMKKSSSDGFIVAVEDHEHYRSIEVEKHTFAELAHERNREGNFFCLMFIAEIKPTLEQVFGIDQSTVFELTELKKWIEIAKYQQEQNVAFLDVYVDELSKFVYELTNAKWSNRPFIEIDKINRFIDGVIKATINDGLFYNALGKCCIHLGGINCLSEFSPLKNSDVAYRKIFRAIVTKTLLRDIDFWRAIHKNKEIELPNILENLTSIRSSDNNLDDFCNAVERYFNAYFECDKKEEKKQRFNLQNNFDSLNPYVSVLQTKNIKSKLLLGNETILYCNDNDITLSEDDNELLQLIDITSQKPDINELRKFYFSFSKQISSNIRLDQAWHKEISNSKVSECTDIIEGILGVLSKSLLLSDIGDDIVVLSLARDRTRKNLERKNWYALNYFNHEYKDLSSFWSQFGNNFKIDFGKVFDENFSESVDKKFIKTGDGKTSNELNFRIVRHSSHDNTPKDSWELRWLFNPYGFESSKYLDYNKVIERKGFFHKHSLSLDPLFIKKTESTPTINNIHMFLAASSNMKKGTVVKKLDKESSFFFDLLTQLKNYNYITDYEFSNVQGKLQYFTERWHLLIQNILENPICGLDIDLEPALSDLINTITSLNINREKSNELLYDIISSHTLNLTGNTKYCVYLPWSPFSLLMQSKRNSLLKKISNRYKNNLLSIANKSDGVLAKLFKELLTSYGKSVYLQKTNENTFEDLVSTKSNSGYFEFGKLTTSKNAISDTEIRSVINATSTKFLETYPNERHHLQILCIGLFSYQHLLAVYDELIKISGNHEEDLSIALAFTCTNRADLDSIYQTICESFDSARVDSNITIKIVSDINEVENGEVDLIYNFDPLFSHNKIAVISPKYFERDLDNLNWEFCSSRKVPSDPVTRKTQFSMNNHVQDSTGRLFHSAFMRSNNLKEDTSFCREVSQTGLKEEITKGLSKCNWLIVYDYLLSKETLSACCAAENTVNRRVLRYIQGEGSKRSLAIITDKETHYITKKLNEDLRSWKLVHPDDVPVLVDKIFTLSNSFSSDTLLRSVGNGCFSHDLVGTAGAASLLENIFDKKNKVSPIFWVHLDDYLSWFKSSVEDDAFQSIGRTVNYISDLLGIYISLDNNGATSINLIVSESKLTKGSVEQSIKSCKQIKSTVDLISSMLYSSKDIDFEYWLNKFYEFIVGNFRFAPNEFDFQNLIELDKSQVKVNISGISIVFNYDNPQAQTTSEYVYNTNYLSQLKLSSDDTQLVFRSMIEGVQQSQLFNDFEFFPLKLNQGDNEQSTFDDSVSSTEETKTEFDVSSLLLDKYKLANSVNKTEKETTTSLGEQRSLNSKSTTNEPILNESHSLLLLKTCVEFLDKNTSDQSIEKLDLVLLKSNIRKIFGFANLPSTFADTLVTPNSIVIKLHGDANLSAAKILKLKDNFLSIVGLSLRQVYPASGVMVLVFNREKRETVFFGKLINSTLASRIKTIEQDFNNKVMLGQDEFSENGVFFKLDGASPHALIGGQTKSGKSILMNNMIIDLLITNSPENLHLRLFDPKQVEFVAYKNAPHLAHPVVLDKDDAVIRLKELEILMNERYRHLMTLGVKDFEAYNRKYPKNRMAREVVFFDELADWILDNDFKVEAKDIIVRLSSKGRAAGIHLILATQRPSADVVFPLLRANLDTKIALKVDRDQNSEIILGESGAENLLGYGHGIVKTEGQTNSIQVGFTEPHIFDQLVELVISYWNDLYSYKPIKDPVVLNTISL